MVPVQLHNSVREFVRAVLTLYSYDTSYLPRAFELTERLLTLYLDYVRKKMSEEAGYEITLPCRKVVVTYTSTEISSSVSPGPLPTFSLSPRPFTISRKQYLHCIRSDDTVYVDYEELEYVLFYSAILSKPDKDETRLKFYKKAEDIAHRLGIDIFNVLVLLTRFYAIAEVKPLITILERYASLDEHFALAKPPTETVISSVKALTDFVIKALNVIIYTHPDVGKTVELLFEEVRKICKLASEHPELTQMCKTAKELYETISRIYGAQQK